MALIAPEWHRVSILVNNLLHSYKEHRRAKRKQPRDPSSLAASSYVQAKDWSLKQQKAQWQSEPLQTSAVNEEAREVVA